MKKQLHTIIYCLFIVCQIKAQTNKIWTTHQNENNKIVTAKGITRLSFPEKYDLYDLNINSLREILFSSTNRMNSSQGTIITLPNTTGQLEQFEMFEASNFDPDLQAQFPNIRAYVGIGLTDKEAQLRLSISPQGIQTMVFRSGKETEFMEPYSQDGKVYAVFNSSRNKGKLPFTCSTEDVKMSEDLLKNINTSKSNSGQLFTFRLAVSCNAEYANYFGATNSAQVGLVIAAFNNTLTRCNGIYEKDFAVHLNLIANTTSVIYYNAATDPYSSAPNESNWNKELQNTLTANIGNANYDIGHFFGGNNGWTSAGCVGCICVDDTPSLTDVNKGGGVSSSAEGIPQGDIFDIDYVCHEMGHQLGANHTYSHVNEGLGHSLEPGSGSTIMSYAGVTNQDVQSHSDGYFHGFSIQQVQTNLATKTCQTITPISHGFPIISPGSNYTIPINTPFSLTGSGTTSGGGILTYCWEEMDNGTATGVNSGASQTKTSGPNFRSYPPSTSPTRYFPNLTTLAAGLQITQGLEIPVEALCSVARSYNFRLTVRDNSPLGRNRNITTTGIGQTAYGDIQITVDNTSGPFDVTSQATNGITWAQGASENITWTVNNTNTLSGSSNVDILLSTDGGFTYPTVLLANTPNDGSQSITVPNIIASTCRVMVKPTGNVFFDINSKSFAIGALGLNEVEFPNFSLFPNPNNGNFNVQFTSNSGNEIKINVHDLRGRQVYEEIFYNTGNFNQNINLRKVQTGIYLVSITDGTKKTVKRIVIE